MKRILITGFAGFIGSHLTERLLKDGNEVIGLDNYFTGSKQNVAHLLSNPNLEVIRHDVTIPYHIQCDEIYNLACPASPVAYQRFPVQTINTSLQGMIHALELTTRLNIRVLQASTSEVYGDPGEHPQKETYWGNVNPVGVRSCYDESKRCAETLCMDYHRQWLTDIKIVRISNTFGPRMAENDGRVVSNFIVQALKGENLTIYGDGSQTRSFMYIDDCVEGLVKMMNSGMHFHGPVNIGSTFEFTMNQLAELVLNLTKSKSKVIHVGLPQDDPKKRQLDISLAKQQLDWEPEINLVTGLNRTINYFKKILL
jgi:UDP-glucuronate decarboxylase